MKREFEVSSGSQVGDVTGIGRILDFSRGKRQNLNNQIDAVISDLLAYGKEYFDNWLDSARARFVSYSQGVDIDRVFLSLFEGWYVINYRFHSDVSPVIDFYTAEYEDLVDENTYNILDLLRDSYLSIYEIIWSQNNTILLKDIFSDNEIMTSAECNKVNTYTPGNLMLARVITIDLISLIVGKPATVSGEYKAYLFDEINSTRIYEGGADFKIFLRDYAEVPAGLIMDLGQGIIKNRVKYRCLDMSGYSPRSLVAEIMHKGCFSLLDRKEKWLKFVWDNDSERFSRLYVGTDRIIAAAEMQEDLNFAIGQISSILGLEETNSWKEGYRLSGEEDSEELLIEIMHDKYIEEWLATPNIELENMTPLLAMKDIKGRVLLENLLNNMELTELRASIRGGYALPTSEIRTKLGLNKDRVQREMMAPEAISIKVKQNRSKQDLSAYVISYNWVNEGCERVAAYLFDLYYYQGTHHENRLAWLLYIWHEFSTIYRPHVTRVKVWAAALEEAFPAQGESAKSIKEEIEMNLFRGLINRKSNLINGHLQRYPLPDVLKPLAHPQWAELDNRKKVCVYRDLILRLQVFARSDTANDPDRQEKARIEFNRDINTSGLYWDEETRDTWQEFFKLFYLLSYKAPNSLTLAHRFWEEEAKRYPPYLKLAAFNVMMSFIGAYSAEPGETGLLIFEDLFTGVKHKGYGRIARNVHKHIIPGTVVITRLLPVGEWSWVDNPIFTLAADMRGLFEQNLQMLMEQLAVNDIGNPDYLKQRGLLILRAYIKTVADFEQNALNLIKQPLEVQWRIAEQLDHQESCRLLTMNERFQLLYTDASRSSYIWIGANNQGYDWGYVLVESGRLLLCCPPGKDENKFRKEIRRSFKVAEIVVACREFKDGTEAIQHLNLKLVNDLACYLNLYPQLMPLLFSPDDLPDKEEEWLQGLFLYRLASMVMQKLRNNRGLRYDL